MSFSHVYSILQSLLNCFPFSSRREFLFFSPLCEGLLLFFLLSWEGFPWVSFLYCSFLPRPKSFIGNPPPPVVIPEISNRESTFLLFLFVLSLGIIEFLPHGSGFLIETLRNDDPFFPVIPEIFNRESTPSVIPEIFYRESTEGCFPRYYYPAF